MIFAAGIGSRLRPLTNDVPKALIQFNGEPLIAGVIKKLVNAGVTEIVVNLHHFANELRDYLNGNKWNADIYFSDESRFLLDTGGGLKKAASFFNDGKPFFAYNVDILSNIDLVKLYQQHLENNVAATLAVRNRNSSRFLLFDHENYLCGWENIISNELRLVKGRRKNLHSLAFSGIQVIDPVVIEQMAEAGRFSIIDVYLRIANSSRIKAFIHDDDYWYDLGTIKQLEEAGGFIKSLQ